MYLFLAQGDDPAKMSNLSEEEVVNMIHKLGGVDDQADDVNYFFGHIVTDV